MRICVIDGQGGGIGKSIVERLRLVFGNDVCIIALGTNALATSLMIKAGANQGASGENAIIVNVKEADFIIGTIGIIAANSMLGELTPSMAEAVSGSRANKILIPLTKCNLKVAGTKSIPLPGLIEEAVEEVRLIFKNDKK